MKLRERSTMFSEKYFTTMIESKRNSWTSYGVNNFDRKNTVRVKVAKTV